MDIGELIRQLERARDESRIDERRHVRIRVANDEDFVWVEAEIVSVEGFQYAPDVVLECRMTPEQEDEVFRKHEEEG